MGVLQRFERRLEGVVSGAFARAFKAEVQPIEIAAALQRELDSNAKILSRDRSLVPNSFCVELGPYDYARLSPHERRLTVELAELVREHADAQHYGFSGPVRVTLAQRDDLGTGQFRLCSDVVAGVDRAATYAPTETAPQRAVAFLEINGESHPVLAPGLVLGRSSESDLRIEDPGISREHAEIRVRSGGGGAQVVLVDLGSTNGSLVDGARVAEAELVDGSQVTLGSTVLVVRIPRARG